MGSLLVDHDNLHAHGLGYDEDVGEDDGGIDEPRVAINGLEGEIGSDFGAATAFKKVVVSLFLVVFGEIAPGCGLSAMNSFQAPWSSTLSHHPYWWALDFFACRMSIHVSRWESGAGH